MRDFVIACAILAWMLTILAINLNMRRQTARAED